MLSSHCQSHHSLPPPEMEIHSWLKTPSTVCLRLSQIKPVSMNAHSQLVRALPPLSPPSLWTLGDAVLRTHTHTHTRSHRRTRIPYEVEVFFLFPRSVIWHPRKKKDSAAEGWTLNSAGRTEGRSSHPNERKRGGPEQKRKKRCAQNNKKKKKKPVAAALEES